MPTQLRAVKHCKFCRREPVKRIRYKPYVVVPVCEVCFKQIKDIIAADGKQLVHLGNNLWVVRKNAHNEEAEVGRGQ